MKLEAKILNGFERISEVLKFLLWEKAKIHGISPIQIQILLFVANHNQDLSNVSYLAKELSVTKATISDAVRVLIKKGYLQKDYSPLDNRRFNLEITNPGNKIIFDLSEYSMPMSKSIAKLDQKELEDLFSLISKLIIHLNKKGVIEVQRTCYNCRHYNGDRSNHHFCELLNKQLLTHDLRLDCPEFKG